MGHPLKSISKAGIPEAIAKAELYRYLNEPEETESICRDILAIEPGHQLALRMLGLSLTDQFIGAASDRYMEVQSLFLGLRDPYEQLYYTGILYERRARTQLLVGYARTLCGLSWKKPCAALRKRKRFGRRAMTTAFFAGIAASDCWKAGTIFTSSGRSEQWMPRTCRPSTRLRAAQAG